MYSLHYWREGRKRKREREGGRELIDRIFLAGLEVWYTCLWIYSGGSPCKDAWGRGGGTVKNTIAAPSHPPPPPLAETAAGGEA